MSRLRPDTKKFEEMSYEELVSKKLQIEIQLQQVNATLSEARKERPQEVKGLQTRRLNLTWMIGKADECMRRKKGDLIDRLRAAEKFIVTVEPLLTRQEFEQLCALSGWPPKKGVDIETG